MKEKNKYLALYTHRYGADILHFSSSKKLEDLDANEVAEALEINWEPERDEYIDFFNFTKKEFTFPDIDKKTK